MPLTFLPAFCNAVNPPGSHSNQDIFWNSTCEQSGHIPQWRHFPAKSSNAQILKALWGPLPPRTGQVVLLRLAICQHLPSPCAGSFKISYKLNFKPPLNSPSRIWGLSSRPVLSRQPNSPRRNLGIHWTSLLSRGTNKRSSFGSSHI